MSYINSYFQLITKSDGTFLKLYPPQQGGEILEYFEIKNYLASFKITESDLISIYNKYKSSHEIIEEKISDIIISPIDEKIVIEISENRMSVVARFYSPSDKGKIIDKADIINELVRSGVKFGVLEKSIDDFLKNRQYCSSVLMACGQIPVNGQDAVITYNFNANKSAKPKTNEDGSVDFHQLDIITHVNQGDLLATLTPADLGKSGIDVCGNPLSPKKVINKILKASKNVRIAPDKKTMYSTVSGHVAIVDDNVQVSDTYEVIGNVDASTGDIIYEGNVTVKGNVITGFSIKAKGDIEVNGAVEGAIICAGGQIILKRGIQGMNKGVLEAGGNIVTKFIENSVVRAGGYITTESIMHSTVSAKGDILVGGKRGFVTGGEVRSATMIKAKTVGSTMGTSTLLEVGIDPIIIEEYRKLEKDLVALKSENAQIKQIVSALRKKQDSNEELSKAKAEQLQKATRNFILSETKIKQASERYEVLKSEMESNVNGRVKIQDTAYQGVRIIISNVIYTVRSVQSRCQFIRDRADIKIIDY